MKPAATSTEEVQCYNRLIPRGLARVPGLLKRLSNDVRVLDLACGEGAGLERLAETFPHASIVGVDGDVHSLDVATSSVLQNGLRGRVSLTRSTPEDFDAREEYDVAIINVSIRGCRDLDRVASNVHRALKPGGHFVISEFPCPDWTAACRPVPAHSTSGVQFLDTPAQNQLTHTDTYGALLAQHGFRNVAAFDLTPVHTVTHGQK